MFNAPLGVLLIVGNAGTQNTADKLVNRTFLRHVISTTTKLGGLVGSSIVVFVSVWTRTESLAKPINEFQHLRLIGANCRVREFLAQNALLPSVFLLVHQSEGAGRVVHHGKIWTAFLKVFAMAIDVFIAISSNSFSDRERRQTFESLCCIKHYIVGRRPDIRAYMPSMVNSQAEKKGEENNTHHISGGISTCHNASLLARHDTLSACRTAWPTRDRDTWPEGESKVDTQRRQ